MHYCYILNSLSLDRYYIGYTSYDAEQRKTRHNEHYYGTGEFTANANDWELFQEIPFQTAQQARKIEQHIKRMKCRIYINNLKKYPEMACRLVKKYALNS